MSIRLLPDNLINQIAAGEVVERPSSVVKELVENSLDAGATSVEVTLVDGGKSLIVISDNGKGISKEDLPIAVERHATSKLPDDDLFNISFFGFRGEALPSIASVSRFSITSRVLGADSAYKIEVNAGIKTEVAPAAHNLGTRIEVRDLFFATPARLKFLKTTASETSQCVDIINRIALANPNVSFYLYSDNKTKISLAAEQGELFDARLKRLTQVMGRDFGDNSILIDTARENVKITGYTSLPTLNKANSLSQYLFVNNRPVRDKLLLGAIKGAYQDVLASNRYPCCALFIDVSPEDVDVNVHPTKAEVRFYDSQLVRGVLVSAIRKGLSHDANKTFQVNNLEVLLQDKIPETVYLNEHSFATFAPVRHSKAVELPELERNFSVKNIETPKDDISLENLGYLGQPKAQFHNTYIISQNQDSIIIIDQHASHERVVMENMKKNLLNGSVKTQMLLIPEIVELPLSDKTRLLEFAPELVKLGLDVEEFGGSAIIVREVPALIASCNIQTLIEDLSQEMSEWGKGFALEDKLHHVVATLACHGSVRAGRALNYEEMSKLLRDMETTPNSGQCNHGRPTYIELKIKDIAKLFDR